MFEEDWVPRKEYGTAMYEKYKCEKSAYTENEWNAA